MYDEEKWGANSDDFIEGRVEADLRAFKEVVEAAESRKAA